MTDIRAAIRGTILAVLMVLVCAAPALAEKRVALVIGNSAYTAISPLDNPKNDADLMAATLRDVGFEVVSATDVDVRAMGRAVRDFGKALRLAGKDAVGLFYYAGHGVQVGGANYLLPVGSEIDTEADLRIDAFSASDVLAQMEEAGNALNLVILDACRNNPFQGKFRSGSRGLARIKAASGALVAFAAAPGQVAADGAEANSPYTAALAVAMKEPGLAVEQMFKRVRVSVESQTGGAQTPWEESSLRGDFYFVPGSSLSPPVPGPVPPGASTGKADFGSFLQSVSKSPLGFLAAISGAAQQELSAEKIITFLESSATPVTGGAEAILGSLQNSFRVDDADPTVKLPTQSTASVIDNLPKVDFEIFFDYNAAVIKPESVPVLMELGKALSDSRFADSHFIIAGHTDAVGSSTYNARLSLQRADVVRDFLVKTFSIDASHVVAYGFGEEQLRDPANPDAATNRRVEVINIGQ